MVTVHFFAGARAAAGRSEERLDAPTLESLIAALSTRNAHLAAVLAASSYLIDGLAAHDRGTPLADGASIDVLPPFAGG